MIQFWRSIIDEKIEILHKEFQKYSGLILTEGDLQSHLHSLLLNSELGKIQRTSDDANTNSIHSEVTWFSYDNESEELMYSGFEVDLTILNPPELEVFQIRSIEESPSKGFFYDGETIGIELKFLRSDKNFLKNIKRDYEKIKDLVEGIKHHSNTYKVLSLDKIHFYVLIGCKTDEFFEKALPILKSTILNEDKNFFKLYNRNLSEIVTPILFSPTKIFYREDILNSGILVPLKYLRYPKG